MLILVDVAGVLVAGNSAMPQAVEEAFGPGSADKYRARMAELTDERRKMLIGELSEKVFWQHFAKDSEGFDSEKLMSLYGQVLSQPVPGALDVLAHILRTPQKIGRWEITSNASPEIRLIGDLPKGRLGRIYASDELLERVAERHVFSCNWKQVVTEATFFGAILKKMVLDPQSVLLISTNKEAIAAAGECGISGIIFCGADALASKLQRGFGFELAPKLRLV